MLAAWWAKGSSLFEGLRVLSLQREGRPVMTQTFLASLLMLFWSPISGHAQQTQQSPCSRGASTIVMGGVNLDEMKCQLALMAQTLGEKDSQSAALAAALLLLRGDLAKAQQVTITEGTWWGSCIKSDACVAWVNSGAQKPASN